MRRATNPSPASHNTVATVAKLSVDRRLFLTVAVLAPATALVGCGQRGPLYIEDQDVESADERKKKNSG